MREHINHAVKGLLLMRDILVKHNIKDDDGFKQVVGSDIGVHADTKQALPLSFARQHVVKKTDALIADLDAVKFYGINYETTANGIIFLAPTIAAVQEVFGDMKANDSIGFEVAPEEMKMRTEFKVGDEIKVSHKNYRDDVHSKIVTIERILPCDDTKTNIWTSDGHVHFSTECELSCSSENELFGLEGAVNSFTENSNPSGPKIR